MQLGEMSSKQIVNSANEQSTANQRRIACVEFDYNGKNKVTRKTFNACLSHRILQFPLASIRAFSCVWRTAAHCHGNYVTHKVCPWHAVVQWWPRGDLGMPPMSPCTRDRWGLGCDCVRRDWIIGSLRFPSTCKSLCNRRLLSCDYIWARSAEQS